MQRESLKFDWRWVVVGYCSLILMQLFPSYFLFGLRRLPLTQFSGAYLLWMAIGVGIVAAFMGSRSKGSPVLESLSVSLFYLLTVIFLYRGGFKAFLPYTTGRMKILLLILFLLFAVAGTIIGKLAGLRREKRQRQAQGV